MIWYRFVPPMGRLGKTKGHHQGLALIAVGSVIAVLGFRSLLALGVAANVIGWSGVVLALFGLSRQLVGNGAAIHRLQAQGI